MTLYSNILRLLIYMLVTFMTVVMLLLVEMQAGKSRSNAILYSIML